MHLPLPHQRHVPAANPQSRLHPRIFAVQQRLPRAPPEIQADNAYPQLIPHSWSPEPGAASATSSASTPITRSHPPSTPWRDPRHRPRSRRLEPMKPPPSATSPGSTISRSSENRRGHDGRCLQPPTRIAEIWATGAHPRRASPQTRLPATYLRRAHGTCLLCDLRRHLGLAPQKEHASSSKTTTLNSSPRRPLLGYVAVETLVLLRSAPRQLHRPHPPRACRPRLPSSKPSPPATTISSKSPIPLHHGLPPAPHPRPRAIQTMTTCTCHAHFHPPLPLPLRRDRADRVVGFEMLGMPQRDLTPENCAAAPPPRPSPKNVLRRLTC